MMILGEKRQIIKKIKDDNGNQPNFFKFGNFHILKVPFCQIDDMLKCIYNCLVSWHVTNNNITETANVQQFHENFVEKAYPKELSPIALAATSAGGTAP